MVPRTRLALAVMACLGTTEALAQSAADTGRGVTVLTRPRPELDPPGMRIGSFRLDASATGGLGYDSNIFGNNAIRRGSGFWDTYLAAALSSEWTTHALSVTAGLSDRRYFDQSSLDFTDWNAGIAGRYDFSGSANISAGYQHVRSHLPVSSVDVQQAGILQQVPFSSDEFRLGGTIGINRLSLTAEGNYRMFRFDSVGADYLAPGTNPNTALLDFNTFAAGLSAAYELAPGRAFLLTGRIQDVRYADSAYSDRNSFTWAVLAGFRYDFDGVWQASAAVGYLQRDFNGPQYAMISAPILEAQVFYNVTQITTLSLAARRSVDESVRTDAASYLRTFVRLGVDHELRRNVILSGALVYDRRDYKTPSQHSDDGAIQLGAQWFLNRSVSIGLNYQYTNRFSRTTGLPAFDQNLAMLRLRIAL